MSETYKLSQGKIIINKSDSNFSEGVLILNSHSELPKHNRPVDEVLTQISGQTSIKILKDDGAIEEIILKEKEGFTIPKNEYHIHANPNDDFSETLWSFKGDVTEVIENIRKSF